MGCSASTSCMLLLRQARTVYVISPSEFWKHMYVPTSGNSDSSRHLGVLADCEDATDGRHDRVEAPEGHKEARNEAGEAGYTSVEGPKGAEFEA